MNKNFLKKIVSHRFSFEKSVGGIVFCLEDNHIYKYLLLQYPHKHWDFVKGHVETGETEEETLRREMYEETGINEINQIYKNFREKISFCYSAKGSEREKRIEQGRGLFICKNVFYYIAQISDMNIRLSDEHIDFGWFTTEEALSKVTFENSKNLLKKAVKIIEK